MNPTIQTTEFGRITVADQVFDHDVVIGLDQKVRKRKKKLSKREYGTSHKVSLEEAKDLFEKGAKRLLIGSGQYGNVELSPEAKEYFEKKDCSVTLLPTPEAIQAWNELKGDHAIGMFHVTC